MKPLTIALLAGAAALVLIATRRRSSGALRPDLLTGELRDTSYRPGAILPNYMIADLELAATGLRAFGDESWQLLRWGNIGTTAAIPDDVRGAAYYGSNAALDGLRAAPFNQDIFAPNFLGA